MEFIYEKKISSEKMTMYYHIRCVHNKIIYAHEIAEMLNISIDDVKDMYLQLGGEFESFTDMDGLEYNCLIFKSEDTVKQAVQYLNEKYAPLLAMLYTGK